MKKKNGMVLLYVMIISFILFLICSMLMKWRMQMSLIRSKAVKSAGGLSELEKARAGMWECLNDKGYPPAGSCSATAAQRQCVPAAVTAEFAGDTPDCIIKLSIDKQ
ncbi:MAG: hypothetical protein A2X28_04155 [Elusimicrobia bacterium GWA2_56_46]|nr:MAG: hypothetical protein A2X28_04155 [Elusimicrobia bacterium GWA2_56_46]OGR56070.1 MAG: hypothetical protein A2X39_07575 [Elusimicrobia bacterium GWC2_56_31]HBW22903.1 hypothetical protein [Elusimicrobiota bacterium]